MTSLKKFFLDCESALLLVVDIQEKLCKAMDPEILSEKTGNVAILLEAAEDLGFPVLASEQYPSGLGRTLPVLKNRIATPPLEKMSFSCCGDAALMEKIGSYGRDTIVITGMEAHVCVLQTVLELLDRGYSVHVVSDAVISRKKKNWRIGLELAGSAGAVITSTETVLFQLLKTAGNPTFKRLSKLVR
jgi:isochorismate hydrolase